jgi:four helix bundle protein
VFHDAHSLTLAIYKHTKGFPKEEWFGIRQQMRRAATSTPSNIVEGSARRTTADHLKFLYIALGSACEVKYLVGLASDLEFLSGAAINLLAERCDHVVRRMERFVESVEALLASERRSRRPAQRATPAAARRKPGV